MAPSFTLYVGVSNCPLKIRMKRSVNIALVGLFSLALLYVAHFKLNHIKFVPLMTVNRITLQQVCALCCRNFKESHSNRQVRGVMPDESPSTTVCGKWMLYPYLCRYFNVDTVSRKKKVYTYMTDGAPGTPP